MKAGIRNDPVINYLAKVAREEDSSGLPPPPFSVLDFADRIRSIRNRKMSKWRYEKYLSQAVGRKITIEEYEAGQRGIADKLSDINIGTTVDVVGGFARLYDDDIRIAEMRHGYWVIFSSDKYAHLESQ